MRIGGQAVSADFLAEAIELILVQTTFQEGARVNARRRVSLDKDEIAAVLERRRSPEMVEAHFIQSRR